MRAIRVAHLFSGAGGGVLADLILGHIPLVAFEIDPTCCAILRERKSDGWLPAEMEIIEEDIREVDFSLWYGRVDQIAAGFPCQDISSAGSGKGIKGEKSSLVSEVFRAIDDIQPPLVFLENSPAIRTRGRVEIVRELVSRGYSWNDGILAASDVGSPQRRKRWWLLAANSDGHIKLQQARGWIKEWLWDWNKTQDTTDNDGVNWRPKPHDSRRDTGQTWNEPKGSASVPPDANLQGSQEFTGQEVNETGQRTITDGSRISSCTLRDRLQIAVQLGGLSESDAETIQAIARYTGSYDWAPPDSGICGVVHGMATQMDGATKKARIRALANGQVPLQAAMAWLLLAYRGD